MSSYKSNVINVSPRLQVEVDML